jgi:hypothetical protein
MFLLSKIRVFDVELNWNKCSDCIVAETKSLKLTRGVCREIYNYQKSVKWRQQGGD